MKRMSLLVGMLVLLPIVSAAQTAPMAPLPPAPPQAAPPAPPTPPTPPRPVRAPRAVMAAPVMPVFEIDQEAIQEAAAEARAQADVMRIDTQAIREAAAEARVAARAAIADAPWGWDSAPAPFAFQQDRMFMPMSGQSGDSNYYSAGLNAIQQRQFDRAITRFEQAVAQKGSHADGALYWKAFAQYKLSKTDEALATIAELRKSYGQSRYLNDAKALEADIKKPRPDNLDDDEVKLLAIQGLQHSDPERVVPLLETFLSATNSLHLKKQALYVLALSDQPRAHQILLNYSKGNGNPDLQREAIGYIAARVRRASTTGQTTQMTQATSAELKEIYNSSPDVDVRRAIIDAYASSGDKLALIALAGGDGATEIRQHAISSLSNLAAPQDLWALYEKEQNRDLRLQIVRAFSSMGAVDQLMQVVKTEKDPGVRQGAIRSLGNMRTEKTGSTLIEMYSADQDKDTRKAVISALGNQNNADGLVAIARKEKDTELRVDIVRKLVDLAPRSKAASDYLMEVIK